MSKAKNTKIKLRGLLGYNSLLSPDNFTKGSGKEKYTLSIAVSEEQAAKLEELGAKRALSQRGEPKSMSNIGVEGVVFKASRLVSLGKPEIVDSEGNLMTNLLGYGSTIVVEAIISSYTADKGPFTSIYLNKIVVEEFIEPKAKDEDLDNVMEAII